MKYSWSLTSVVVFRPDPSRVDPGQGINRSGGGGSGSLLQRTSSSVLKATATNRIHSNDQDACGMKCYFLFHSEVKFLTRSRRLLGLSHFALF